MNLRIAKKVIMSRHWRDKFRKMRPPFVNEEGHLICPSWHDIPVVHKAVRMLIKHNKYPFNAKSNE